MTHTYFTDRQILPLIVSSIILVISAVTFHVDKKQIALTFLFFGSLGLGFFIANLDNFLIIWDEQYHALVAKHMLDNPFRPTLYSIPLLDYDYKNWTSNHVWVHKQPLFLWQMALSLKMFGINEMAIRIPSILLHACTTLIIYRIGKICVSANVGYYGALFFSVAYFPLEMIAGKFATDHNDLVFLCYVTASFWAWFEYSNSQNKFWLILIGIFSGCAVLVKWLPGLLIFATWLISIGIDNKNNLLKAKSYFPILTSSLISLVVFLPWQIYIFIKFPLEAKNEYLHNLKHFSEPLDGHGGDFLFHIKSFADIYGSGILVPIFYLFGIFILIKRSHPSKYKSTMLSSIILTYLFYSLASTKMIAFCLIVSPFFFIGLGTLIDSSINFIKFRIKSNLFTNSFSIIILTVVCAFLINLSKIQNYHTNWKPNDNCNRQADIKEMAYIDKLKRTLGNNDFVVFNANLKLNGHIPIMFYTDYVAYNFIPTEQQLDHLKPSKYKIAILDNDSLPQYIIHNIDIIKIKP
jgi:4-amino-4-deoxy-L-arabinose transferase-like glycosyltransferase